VWDENGYIVTNYHVIRSAESAQVCQANSLTGHSDPHPPRRKVLRDRVLPQTSKWLQVTLTDKDGKQLSYKATLRGFDADKVC
jgi:hypothetical protein